MEDRLGARIHLAHRLGHRLRRALVTDPGADVQDEHAAGGAARLDRV